ncbi:MAG: amidohydrolase [Halioglobus sp.]
MRNALLLLLASTLSACGSERGPQSDEPPAAQQVDSLYINGRIWTGSNTTGDASVMAVTDGHISYVGPASSSKFVSAETIDLQGRFVMPGFIDNHVHFLEGGAALASVDLRGADSPEVFSQRIIDYATTLPAGRWVLNGNWDHELWGGELPRRQWIDQETTDTPVFVIRLDGHMALANSAALKAAGITAATVAPSGGEIVRDESGTPTGILKGNALNLVFSAIPTPSEGEVLEVFELAQSHALSLGLVQVHAVTANETETKMLEAFRLAEDRGVMKIRAFVSTPIEYWEDTRNVVREDGNGTDLLRWGGVKGFVDGSLGATTAWFYEPYLDAPGTSGGPLTDPVKLTDMLRRADSAGLQIAIHAIGDRAIDDVIADMRDMAGDEIANKRYRIEHFQHPSQSAIQLAAEYGIVASMQPYHAIDDGRWAEGRIGPDRIKTTYAFRTILDAGVNLTFGSDWPVAPLSPLDGVYAAVTRRTTDGSKPGGWQPAERISVEEALIAYTATNAYANFEEDVAGTLEVGKKADFVVLAEDPRLVDPTTIPQIDVVATVIDGEVVYRGD